MTVYSAYGLDSGNSSSLLCYRPSQVKQYTVRDIPSLLTALLAANLKRRTHIRSSRLLFQAWTEPGPAGGRPSISNIRDFPRLENSKHAEGLIFPLSRKTSCWVCPAACPQIELYSATKMITCSGRYSYSTQYPLASHVSSTIPGSTWPFR
jgi:hypothetical protein